LHQPFFPENWHTSIQGLFLRFTASYLLLLRHFILFCT